MVKVLSHKLDKAHAVEIVVLEDGHGRQTTIQVPVFFSSDCAIAAAIERAIAEFAAQEQKITEHEEKLLARKMQEANEVAREKQ